MKVTWVIEHWYKQMVTYFLVKMDKLVTKPLILSYIQVRIILEPSVSFGQVSIRAPRDSQKVVPSRPASRAFLSRPVPSRPARSCPVPSRPARSCPVPSRPARERKYFFRKKTQMNRSILHYFLYNLFFEHLLCFTEIFTYQLCYLNEGG